MTALGSPIRKMLRIALPLTAVVALLSSCIQVEETVKIQANGSGSLSLNYQIARTALDVSHQVGETSILPLPAAPSTLRTALESATGLQLQNFSPQSGPEGVGASASIAFDSVAHLNQVVEQISSTKMRLFASSDQTTFSQSIYPGNPNGVDSRTMTLIKQLYANYRLSFTLDAPSPIQQVSIGTIAKDKRSATYTTTIPDILQSKSPILWEVSW